MLPQPISAALYWDGQIQYTPHGSVFYEGRAKKLMTMKRRILYSELLEKIYGYMGLDQQQARLHITFRCPVLGGAGSGYSAIPVTDDEAMEAVLDISTRSVGIVELYIESEPINQMLHMEPTKADLLYRQAFHRSSYIWSKQIDDTPLISRRHDGLFWSFKPVHPRVLFYLDSVGFGGVYRTGQIRLDHALITSLVERWRPETHTFHLTIGEATVTLQDVSLIWGLPIDGPPVTGVDTHRNPIEWQTLCTELLGFRPDLAYFDGSRLKLSALHGPLSSGISEDATDEQVQQYSRMLILVLIGGHLFSDMSGNKVNLIFLQNIRDLQPTTKLSWGSAVLATLYRNLCSATSPKLLTICGPLVLLQLWAWERLPTMSPKRLAPYRGLEPDAPLGQRWDVEFDVGHLGMHVLVIYRYQLDSMKDGQFIWQPYTGDIIQSLPSYCTDGSDIWRSMTPLICYHIVEVHLPDRVLRQFGMAQHIPSPADTLQMLHRVDRRGRMGTDWVDEHCQYIDQWHQRHATVYKREQAGEPSSSSTEYMTWYRQHARLVIGPPMTNCDQSNGFQGSAMSEELLSDAVHRIYYQAVDALPHAEGPSASKFEAIQDMCSTALRAVGQVGRLGCRPSDALTAEHVDALDNRPTIHNVRRSHSGIRRTGRRRRGGHSKQHFLPVQHDQPHQAVGDEHQGEQFTSEEIATTDISGMHSGGSAHGHQPDFTPLDQETGDTLVSKVTGVVDLNHSATGGNLNVRPVAAIIKQMKVPDADTSHPIPTRKKTARTRTQHPVCSESNIPVEIGVSQLTQVGEVTSVRTEGAGRHRRQQKKLRSCAT